MNGGQSLTIAGNLSSDNVRPAPNRGDPVPSKCARITSKMRQDHFDSSRTVVRFIVRFTRPTKPRWLAFETHSASQIQNSPTPDNPINPTRAGLCDTKTPDSSFSASSSVSSLIPFSFVLNRSINGKRTSL
jgi:hypothetical protein